MSLLARDPERIRVRSACDRSRRPDAAVAPPGRARSFDEVLCAAWDALGAGRVIRCLVCSGAMAPAPVAAGALSGRSVAGACRSCGSTLT